MRENKEIKNSKLIQRDELADLYKHYESVQRDELDFFFKYFNFYIGLLSALLVASLAGLLNIKNMHNSLIGYCLLFGPVLIIALSYISYKVIRVYYRRFLQAVLTIFNLRRMLGYNDLSLLAENIFPPLFPDKSANSFIVEFRRYAIKQVFEKGMNSEQSGEKVLEDLLKSGETLKYAKLTLIGFRIVAFCLGIFIIYLINTNR